jgi:hypothetical protein
MRWTVSPRSWIDRRAVIHVGQDYRRDIIEIHTSRLAAGSQVLDDQGRASIQYGAIPLVG